MINGILKTRENFSHSQEIYMANGWSCMPNAAILVVEWHLSELLLRDDVLLSCFFKDNMKF